MVIECEVDDLDNMLRLANVSGLKIMCDEPETIGGNGTAPAPLHYLAASILFGETTQIERYSQLMKVTITKFRAEATVYFDIPGSVLAGTIKAGAPKVETRYEIESPHDLQRWQPCHGSRKTVAGEGPQLPIQLRLKKH